MSLKRLFVCNLFLILLLGGCVHVTHIDCYGTADDIIPRLDLKDVFTMMACELCGNCTQTTIDDSNSSEAYETTASSHVTFTEPDAKRKLSGTLMITDFVDLNTLKPGKAGILMAELLKSRLIQSCSVKIYQVEFSRFFSLDSDGFIVLTRDPKNIRNDEFSGGNCMVGTYSFSKDRLHIFIKLIDMNTGKITRMVDREISIFCWHDLSSGSQYSRNPSRITIKVQ